MWNLPALLYLTCLQLYFMLPLTGAYFRSQQSVDSRGGLYPPVSPPVHPSLFTPENYKSPPYNNFMAVQSQLRHHFDQKLRVSSNAGNSNAANYQRSSNKHSFSDDLALVDHFADYLIKITKLDNMEPVVSRRPFNALLYVLLGLGKFVRNACAGDNFNEVYDMMYNLAVEDYYLQGLENADEIGLLVKDYIDNGNRRIAKIRQLKQRECDLVRDCAVNVDEKLHEFSLVYAKELETLKSIAHLARSFFSYADEFNQAAQDDAVLPYFQQHKDHLRKYVMHAYDALEHLADQPVLCKKLTK